MEGISLALFKYEWREFCLKCKRVTRCMFVEDLLILISQTQVLYV